MSDEHITSEKNFIIDKILEKELGKAGFKSGVLGAFANSGLLNNIDDAFAGNLGASWAASKLKIDEVHVTISLQKNLRLSMITIIEALSSIGTLIDGSKYTDYPVVLACCGSGYANMNPAIVCVEFVQIDNEQTDLYISAYAKEGLIKQKTAIKAIKKLKSIINI